MTGRSGFSAQTLSVLAVLCEEPSGWQHGYAIAKDTGLKSGTLYPILIRLADRGLVEACWEDEQPAGRPRRHLYRLTADGRASARAALEDVPSARRAREDAGLKGGRRVSLQVAPWTR
jgi:DNA-binding PadR family transcriptional regulator